MPKFGKGCSALSVGAGFKQNWILTLPGRCRAALGSFCCPEGDFRVSWIDKEQMDALPIPIQDPSRRQGAPPAKNSERSGNGLVNAVLNLSIPPQKKGKNKDTRLVVCQLNS